MAVAAVVWGWTVGQYPFMLIGHITIEAAAANPATMDAVLISLVVGVILVVPSLVTLFILFQRSPAVDAHDDVTPQLPAAHGSRDGQEDQHST